MEHTWERGAAGLEKKEDGALNENRIRSLGLMYSNDSFGPSPVLFGFLRFIYLRNLLHLCNYYASCEIRPKKTLISIIYIQLLLIKDCYINLNYNKYDESYE